VEKASRDAFSSVPRLSQARPEAFRSVRSRVLGVLSVGVIEITLTGRNVVVLCDAILVLGLISRSYLTATQQNLYHRNRILRMARWWTIGVLPPSLASLFYFASTSIVPGIAGTQCYVA